MNQTANDRIRDGSRIDLMKNANDPSEVCWDVVEMCRSANSTPSGSRTWGRSKNVIVDLRTRNGTP